MVLIALQTGIMLFLSSTTANLQFAMPYQGMVPMVPAAPPVVQVPLQIPIPVPVLVPENKTTENTTTEKPEQITTQMSVKIVIPYPSFGVPPLAPPSIQSFPLSFPQIVVIPEGSIESYDSLSTSESSESTSSSGSSSTESESDSETESSQERRRRKRRRKKRRKKHGIRRSNHQTLKDNSKSEEIKPLLTYISKDGDIKLKWPLTKKEALLLMHKDDSVEKIQIVAKVENSSKPKRTTRTSTSTNKQNKKKVTVKKQKKTLRGNKKLMFRSLDDQTDIDANVI